MWRNYLAVTLRRIARSPAFTAITVGGLALGLAGCLLILSYIRYEQSYDRWIPDSERIYQVQTRVEAPGKTFDTQASAFPVYTQIADGFPQVETVTSVALGKTVLEHDGQPMFLDATTVDRTFFKVFDLPFLHGSAETALPDPHAIVLTESEAIRQFGTADVLGRSLTLGAGPGKTPFRISGVLRDLPRDTNLRVGIVYLRDLGANGPPEWERSWWSFGQQHFVKLRKGADAAAINRGLPAWESRVMPTPVVDGKKAAMADAFAMKLVPLSQVHLGPVHEGAFVPGGDPRALTTFAIVAALTLGMAVINFVNLSTARATQRAREVALRKLLGARRRQLVAQFLGESLLLCFAAMLIALAIVELATPWISGLLSADLRFTYVGAGGMLVPVLGLFAFTGVAGGLYPALVLSGFRPAVALRTTGAPAETRGGGRLRAALVIVQFAIATGLIASTIVIVAQTRFVERVDPGYRRDGLIQIANAWRFTQGSEYEAARKAMLAIPGVTATARSGLALGDPQKAARMMRAPGDTENKTISFYGIDGEFLHTMDTRLLAGRLLGDRFAEDRIASGKLAADPRAFNVVVNRAAAKLLGYRAPQAAEGKAIEIDTQGGPMAPATIVGVVEDIRYRSVRDAAEPVVYFYDPEQTSTVMVRYTQARPGEVMAGLQKVWRTFEPEIPFEARFADDIIRELYAADRARGILFGGFALLAIVIACLGLYSLAAFATERRTKEIGIRKVVGARVRDIVRLLTWQFSRPVVLANLIAWPVAWWAMRDWLNSFDARIPLGPGPFALAGLIAFGIAIATVAGQAFRVARMNPVHALRYE